MSGAWIAAALSGVLLACGVGGTATAPPRDGSALHIGVEYGDTLTLRATYSGDDRDLSYSFSVLREGSAGRSESRQGGAVGASDTLAVSTVNATDGDRVTARLSLLRDGVQIDSTTWSETMDS